MQKFKQFFLKKYADEKPEIQHKVSSLLIVDLFLILTTLLIILTIDNLVQQVIISLLFCSFVSFPLVIRAGKYKLISSLTAFILMVAVIGIVFTQEFENCLFHFSHIL